MKPRFRRDTHVSKNMSRWGLKRHPTLLALLERCQQSASSACHRRLWSVQTARCRTWPPGSFVFPEMLTWSLAACKSPRADQNVVLMLCYLFSCPNALNFHILVPLCNTHFVLFQKLKRKKHVTGCGQQDFPSTLSFLKVIIHHIKGEAKKGHLYW